MRDDGSIRFTNSLPSLPRKTRPACRSGPFESSCAVERVSEPRFLCARRFCIFACLLSPPTPLPTPQKAPAPFASSSPPASFYSPASSTLFLLDGNHVVQKPKAFKASPSCVAFSCPLPERPPAPEPPRLKEGRVLVRDARTRLVREPASVDASTKKKRTLHEESVTAACVPRPPGGCARSSGGCFLRGCPVRDHAHLPRPPSPPLVAYPHSVWGKRLRPLFFSSRVLR